MIRFLCIALMLLLGLVPMVGSDVEPGVSQQLAEARARNISGVEYRLALAVPAEVEQPVKGKVELRFTLARPSDVVLDFQGSIDGSLTVNGKTLSAEQRAEHIVLPRRVVRRGSNTVQIAFTSTDQALNRHADYLYTLFVPDHARSCFPCFDQPDMKALFRLELVLPQGWTSISSDETHPLPTYLFSFAAGRFEKAEAERDGRQLTVLHRETDPAKVAQLPTVFDQMALALRWLEAYTGIAHPFSRYGAVVLPGYQFGGMEHPGAIQLNANTIFLPPAPTPDELMNRLHLIAHETAHLWFGDLVTMRWFNDVWTKEVFANLMADKIAREEFPQVDHDLSFLKSHYPLALSTDRTPGTHPIQQPLDNLNKAGLLYGNIIYHKAPIMMSKLEEQMGADAFQRGLRTYLKRYSYANATWDDLIAILDGEALQANLLSFDQTWVKQGGLAVLDGSRDDNADGRGYGRYANVIISDLNVAPATKRYGRMMMLYENWLEGRQTAADCLQQLFALLAREDNALVASTCCSYLAAIVSRQQTQRDTLERQMLALSGSHALPSVRQQLLRYLGTNAMSSDVVDSLYVIWKGQQHPLLSEVDYMRMSYHLAIMRPAQWQQIVGEQRSRLTNADRRREYDFVSRACNPSAAAQDSLFASLKDVHNRLSEPWACAVVALLSGPERSPQNLRFIMPGLELLPELQQTGGIFFPRNWLSALLGGHYDDAARSLVYDYLDQHPDLLPALRLKVLEQAYYIR